jgi:hypothetical protein
MELSQWHSWWKRQWARELRSILRDEWDPIGVQQIDPTWPRDEYDMYMTPIIAQLRADPVPGQIAALLGKFRSEEMGVYPNDDADMSVARRISSWYSRSMSDSSDIRAR